jgi:hypothetical protein
MQVIDDQWPNWFGMVDMRKEQLVGRAFVEPYRSRRVLM